MTFEHDNLLISVRKPGRYIGREWNSIVKDHSMVDVSACLAYPDAYEVGMSNLGLTILYDIINSDPAAVCERVFAPWPDMEEALRGGGVPLWSLETQKPVRDFDILGITLQYELNFTNVLNLIDLSAIPLHSADRTDDDPIVIAGGPCAFNPEPLAPFIDAFVIGDGEEAITEIMGIIRSIESTGRGVPLGAPPVVGSREQKIKALASLAGVYVPALYDETKGPVVKRTVDNLEAFYPPCSPPVPNLEVVHDRLQVEVMRGCGRSCRFCQAGMIYRPVRHRSAETVISAAREGLANTGYNEVSLVSLSTTDYPGILEVAGTLVPELSKKAIAVSLPSQRVDAFSLELAGIIGGGKQTSLTFAPEAGTQRLRDVINKGVTEEDLINTARIAFENGWRKLKMYFMVGLPTETQEDLDGIVDLAYKMRSLAMETVPKSEHGRVGITINVASFIPKSHTPFQWYGQDSLETLTEKTMYLRSRLKKSYLNYKWHEPSTAKLEGAIARGDVRVAKVIETAFRDGLRFDSWHEYFDFAGWQKAFANAGLTMEEFADRPRDIAEALPWDRISTGVSKEFMAREYMKALEAATTEDCLTGCANCGVKCRG